jgi:hypothetical protein
VHVIVREGGFAFGWNTLVALGTFALAFGTFFLALQARDEARAVKRESQQIAAQVVLQREQMDAALRPYVVPFAHPDWSWDGGRMHYSDNNWRNLLPVKNAGPGAALNVQGALSFGPPSGVTAPLIRTNLAPGDQEDLRVHVEAAWSQGVDWKGVAGWLDYEDIQGGRWRTNFRIEQEGTARHLNVQEVRILMRPDGTPVNEAPA